MANWTADKKEFMQNLAKELQNTSLEKMVNAAISGKCPFCHKEVTIDSFRDSRSRREFEISGICQKCQDDFFGV